MKKSCVATVAGLSLLGVAGCSQGSESPGAATPNANAESATVATATGTAPAPFDQPGVPVALVQNTGQGDYFQQYLNGTKKQAEALKMKLTVYDAQGDNAQQATQLDQAIASGAKGIIVRHGFPDTLCPGVNKALDQGIKVVIYDVEIQKCAPRAVQTQQSDAQMAGLVLDQMKKDIGTDKPVGYVNVAGIAPLDRRDAVWKKYLTENSWTQKFKTGKYTPSTATDTAPWPIRSPTHPPTTRPVLRRASRTPTARPWSSPVTAATSSPSSTPWPRPNQRFGPRRSVPSCASPPGRRSIPTSCPTPWLVHSRIPTPSSGAVPRPRSPDGQRRVPNRPVPNRPGPSRPVRRRHRWSTACSAG